MLLEGDVHINHGEAVVVEFADLKDFGPLRRELRPRVGTVHIENVRVISRPARCAHEDRPTTVWTWTLATPY